MAGTKISQLTDLATISGSENLVVQNGTTNNKVSLNKVKEFATKDINIYDIIDLKFTTDVATTRKLIPASNRKQGLKISYRNASNVYIAEQYKGTDISDTAWTDDSNWKGCRTPLTPLFEDASAVFNDETGYYELNEIYDLTEAEIIKIYRYSTPITQGPANGIERLYDYINTQNNDVKIRTLFPIFISHATNYNVNFNNTFRGLSDLETLLLGGTLEKPATFINSKYIRFSNNKLRKIFNTLELDKNYTIDIKCSASNLQLLLLKYLHQNLTIESPNILYQSVKYWVDNANNTSAITITVHPTTYSYLTGETEPTTEVGGTTEEWQALVTAAQEKQISFASA